MDQTGRMTEAGHRPPMRWDVRRHAALASTMDECHALAERGEPEGVVVVADAQTAGRGRAGRAWYSPPGQAIYASAVLRPALRPEQVGWLTMIGALAVLDCVSDSVAPHAALGIKWPNDVMVGGKKLAGVLVEASWAGDQLDYAVLGIGLNANTRFDAAPDEVRMRATSLREVLGCEVDREGVLEQLLVAFNTRYARLPESPVAGYARYLDTLGKRVRLSVGDEIVEGEAARVEDDGALVVVTASGEHIVRFGDVMPNS